jgi:SagB-type dehydrogenase family enzyme
MTRPAAAESRRYRRSPLLIMEWESDRVVVVNCHTLCRLRMSMALLNLLAILWAPRTLVEIRAAGFQLSDSHAERLVESGILEEADVDAVGADHCWDAVQLLVQRQQSLGGMTIGELSVRGTPPPVAFKPEGCPQVQLLPPPSSLCGDLDDVLSRRRTVREFGDEALSPGQLSTLLHHSARVTKTDTHEVFGELVFRPFAQGGARSELEIYVMVNNVDSLVRGTYYYEARNHGLRLVNSYDEHQAHINAWLRRAMVRSGGSDPHVVLIITAVFERVMWKYGPISLPLIYRNVGCLYQTLYLVATAMGLAPCAIGASQEKVNSRWLQLDPLVESQVGYFVVGNRAKQSPTTTSED